MTSFTHLFDQAIALQWQDRNTLQGRTADQYWNSVSPFGGFTAATLLNAILLHPDRLGDPLAMTINFAGAIRKGAFSIRVHAARTGRSTQHWQMTIAQDGDPDPVATGTAVFAVRRPTWCDTENKKPDVPLPAALPRFERPEKLPFLQQYDIRYVGPAPEGNAPSSATQCWIGDVPPRPLDFPSIAAYCDIFLPRLFLRRPRPTPISTVTMSINFHIDSAGLERQHGTHALGASRGNVFNGGFHDQEGLLWGMDGSLLATTQQLVWYKDKDET